jgi:hypothetical protein
LKPKTQILRELDLGAIVAEQDRLLMQCFIRHPVLSEVILDRKDVVLGAKGAGKSALWKEFTERQAEYQPIQDVFIRLVTNPAGDPEFRDVLKAISAEEFPDDEELRVGWRLYFLAQFWRAALDILPESDERQKIDKQLVRLGVVYREDGGLKTAFAYALAKARALKQLNVEWLKGLSLDFSDEALRAGGTAAAIPFNDLMNAINALLVGAGIRIWLVLDRLDEIILGDEARENIVLKGLLLAYRDYSDYTQLRVKIFIRDDVYSRVTSLGHFPALTHVRSRAAGPIQWSIEDLLHLVVRRLLVNEDVTDLLAVDPNEIRSSEDRKLVFYSLFPEKVDKGRAAEGFKWIFDRIVDGNGVATPRDLLSVFDEARMIQVEQIEREGIELPGDQLFTEDTLRRAVRVVAEQNLSTRIFAEYPDLVEPIKAFTRGKADHNEETLAEILGPGYQHILLRLERVGFLYRRMRNGINMWTVPFFYSFALDIRRGAAFEFPDKPADEGERSGVGPE